MDKELLQACPHLRHQVREEAAVAGRLLRSSLLKAVVDKTTRRGGAQSREREQRRCILANGRHLRPQSVLQEFQEGGDDGGLSLWTFCPKVAAAPAAGWC